MTVKPEFIQIKATSEEEVNRRIEAFIRNKRKEIDERNIREFISPFTPDYEASCARVEAVYLHREGEKSHITLKEVNNAYGPQTCLPADEDNDSRNARRLPADAERAEAVEERLANMEKHLNMPYESQDIFKRIKALEERIDYLEGVSPEYFTDGIPQRKQSHEWNSLQEKERTNSEVMQLEHLSDIDNRIKHLKKVLKQRTSAAEGSSMTPQFLQSGISPFVKSEPQ